eukprot:scaffold2445_cov205-Alexandrium_tamarense.AAC.30
MVICYSDAIGGTSTGVAGVTCTITSSRSRLQNYASESIHAPVPFRKKKSPKNVETTTGKDGDAANSPDAKVEETQTDVRDYCSVLRCCCINGVAVLPERWRNWLVCNSVV